MIGNLQRKKPLAGVSVLEELAKGELGRFKKAIGKGAEKYFEEHSKGMDPKASRDLWTKVSRASQMIAWTADDAYDTAFAVVKNPDHERRGFDDHLSGVRSVARTTPRGFLLSVIAKQLRLEETATKVSSLVARGTEVQNDIHQVMAKAKEYIDRYEWAKAHAKSFNHEDEELAQKYASLKTWEREEDFTSFTSVAETATLGAIEVIIEGPIKLYLMISEDQFLVVLQCLSALNAFEFSSAEKHGYEDALAIFANSKKAMEGSALFTMIREILAEGAKGYFSLWKEEEEGIRKGFLDEENRKRFIACFENGTLFKA